MGTEQFTQVSPNSTGNKFRNLELVIRQPDGTLATVELEVAAISDKEGNVLDWQEERAWQRAVLHELRAIRLGLQALLSEGHGKGMQSDVDLLEWSRSVEDDDLEGVAP